jgi:hypothetical protein
MLIVFILSHDQPYKFRFYPITALNEIVGVLSDENFKTQHGILFS